MSVFVGDRIKAVNLAYAGNISVGIVAKGKKNPGRARETANAKLKAPNGFRSGCST